MFQEIKCGCRYLCRTKDCKEKGCKEGFKKEFAAENPSQILFWAKIFGVEKAYDVTVRVQVMTCYLELYYLLLITQPDQFKQFLKIIATRRKTMKKLTPKLFPEVRELRIFQRRPKWKMKATVNTGED